MKLHLTQAEGNHLITAYGHGFIEVNTKRYSQSLIVMPSQLHTDWTDHHFDALDAYDFAALLTLNPEVVLLGTGEQHLFLHPRIYQALTSAGIPLECMTTAAACRTYNILMGEGRAVAAALLV